MDIKTYSKSIAILAPPDDIFKELDDFNNSGMHMTGRSIMMMGSKLKLEQLSDKAIGVGSTYHWYGKMMGMVIDFSETVKKWEFPKLKDWETNENAKIVIMSWYRMWFEIAQNKDSSTVTLNISFLPPKEWYYKILSFLFANWYCKWCLNNMLNGAKARVEKIQNKQINK